MAVDSNTFHFTINADASFSATGYFFSNNVYLTNGGAISFNTNTFKVNLVNPNLNAGFTLLSCANTLDISHGSNLQVIENNIQAKINASGVASLWLVGIGNLNVVDSSSVNVSHNDIDAVLHSKTIASLLNLLQLSSSSTYIHDDSIVCLQTNNVVRGVVHSETSFGILQLVGASSNVYVHNNSTITVQNNNVVRGDIDAISLYRGGIFFDGNTAYSIENTSTLAVAGNKANLTQRNDAEVFGIYTSSLKINSNSTLLLQSNGVSIVFENSAAQPKFQILYISVLSMSNSSIEISHHRVTLQIVSGTTSIVVFFWMVNLGFKIQGGSVRLHHNTLESGGNATRLFASVLGVFTDNSIDTNRVSMNESSTILITNNVIESGFGECWLLYISSSDLTLNTTGGSTIYIQDNYIPGVVGTSPIIRLCGLFTTTYFGGNSTIYITNNTAINDVGTVRVFETTSTAPVVLDDMLVVIEGNRVEMAGKPDTMSGKPLVNLHGNITQYFRLLFIDNVITTNISTEGTASSGLIYVVSIDFKNNYPSLTEPLLVVQGNTVTGIGNNQTRGGGYGCFMVFLHATSPVSSAMTPSVPPEVEVVRVVNNSITTTNFSMTDIMRVNFTSHVDPFSVALANNTVTSDTTSVSRLATVTLYNTTTLFSLSTCGNIVNSHVCHETAQGTHSCIAYNHSQVFINDCKTSTVTHSHLRTPSDPSTPTPTPTTTQPLTPSPSVSLPTTATVHGQSTTPTTTSTPTSTTSHPRSTSQTTIDTATPSISNTGATASRCGLGDSSTYYPLCSVITALGLSNEALEDSVIPCVSNVTTTSSPLTISVPFNVWGGGTSSPIRLYFKIGAHFGASIIPRGGSDSPPSSTIQSDNGDAESAIATATKGNVPVISVDVWYTGLPTLAQVVDTIRLPTHTIIRCPINTTGVPYVPSSSEGGGILGGDEYPMTASIQIGIRIQLEAAEPPLPILEPTITTTVVVAVVGSVISGMPSGLVRGGMVSSLQGMMRCSEFDPEDEVDRINNPPMLAVGSSGMDTLQYKRGSVVIGLAVVGAATITLLLSAVFQVLVLGNVRTVGAAMTMLRMPSSVLPIALLVGEMSSGSATTMLLYRSNNSSNQLPTSSIATDALLAIVVLCSTWSVFIYYAYSSTIGCQVVAAPIDFNVHKKDEVNLQQQHPGHQTSDDLTDNLLRLSDADQHNEQLGRRAQLGSFQRLVCFLLEPTHEPSLQLLPARNKNNDNLPNSREGTPTTTTPLPQTIRIEELEVWLQRHYFFVAERRWIAYGAAEALLGSLVDIIEGIPVTSRSLAACAFPPATMAIMLIILLTLLLWKWPFAVRIQQWGSMAVVGLLSLVSTLVTINIFIASVELEEVCGYFLLISSILITIFSVLDIIAWLLMLFPCLREKLGLRPVSLSTALARLRKDAHVPPAMRTEEMATLFIPTHDDDPTTANDESNFYRVAFDVLAYRLRKTKPNYAFSQNTQRHQPSSLKK